MQGVNGTAVEYAAGRGHPDYPVLDARYSPTSRVPCVDFSPWLRAQTLQGDRVAVVAWLLQVVEANPGLAVGLAVDDDAILELRAGILPKSSPQWVGTWARTVHSIFDAPVNQLTGLDTSAEADLRVALLISAPRNLSRTAGLATNGRSATFIAAAMAQHSVGFSDPESAAKSANRIIRAKRSAEFSSPYWDEARDVTPFDVTPEPSNADYAGLIARLSPISRMHLMDLVKWKPDRVGPTEAFGTVYETRSLGFDAAEGAQALIEAGVLQEVDDDARSREYVLNSQLKPQLQELLNAAGVSFSKSATKARLIEVLESSAPHKVDELVTGVQLYEVSVSGKAGARWLAARVEATAVLWSVWMAIALDLAS